MHLISTPESTPNTFTMDIGQPYTRVDFNPKVDFIPHSVTLDLGSVVLWETGKAKYCKGLKVTKKSTKRGKVQLKIEIHSPGQVSCFFRASENRTLTSQGYF
jgi:hypothetical protein